LLHREHALHSSLPIPVIAGLFIIPEKWKYRISSGTKKQFGIIKNLMQREDVTSLVYATDAGSAPTGLSGSTPPGFFHAFIGRRLTWGE
jgi:hypothetical protein